ncbi:MAG TPA: ABC transporter substrate-binding protein [Saprospiraceae bacterium]|nr:ABC transporter substrate-binding protein [Saprospiraceae bacterium]HNT20489.1 ABC transporter substrate-binding protein [Saprospiraceae bacterium]
MKKKWLLYAFFSALIHVFQACDNNQFPPETIEVRGLFSLTGNWSSLGIASQAAIDLAAEDINDYLEDRKSGFKLSVSVADTKLDTGLAKTLFTSAQEDKMGFIIGPQSSAELSAIKPLSDAAEIIVISQSSTAGSLAIAGDAIFRFCPSDKIEGAAMAATIAKRGFKGLVTVARDDAGNKGLQTSTGAAFTEKGGQVAAIPPYAATLTDYRTVVASIKEKLGTLLAVHGMDKVGVYLASFDEGTEIFRLAAMDPVLSNIKWFGGDGAVLSTVFLNDAEVADFAIKTSFFAPSFGLPVANEADWKPVAARIKARTGTEPDAFAIAAYDALWTIAYTIEANQGTTKGFSNLKNHFVEQANSRSGIIGARALDEAGDRANGTYDYFGIAKEGNTYVWKLVGKSTD